MNRSPALARPLIAVAALCALATGCEAHTPEVKDVAPEGAEEAAVNPEVNETPEAAEPAAEAIVVSGSPFDEEHHTFKVAYKAAAAGQVSVREHHAADAREVQSVALNPGQELKWSESVMVVTEPRKITATAEVVLPASPQEDPARNMELKVAQGASVGIVKYQGEGTCLLRFEGSLYSSVCPSNEHFEAEGWDGSPKPAASAWWIKIDKGWVEVDGEKLVGESVEMEP